MSDEARRIDLTAQIIELEPQMLRVLGAARPATGSTPT